MKLIKLGTAAAALTLALAAVPRAAATPLHYEISGGSVSALASDPGLVVSTSIASGLSGTDFTLDDGESSGWFNFFKIWTNETHVNGDDLLYTPITATLMFSDPLANAEVTGVTFGASILWGAGQWGRVEWDGPAVVTLGDRTFSVRLSDETFNGGIFGLDEGKKHGAVVKAKIVQVSSTATPVPDAASSILLLGLGLVSFGLIRRLKLAPQA